MTGLKVTVYGVNIYHILFSKIKIW